MKGLLENHSTDMGGREDIARLRVLPEQCEFAAHASSPRRRLNMSGSQIIRFVKSRERSHALIEIVDPAPSWGSLERRHDRDRAILRVGYPGFDYRETEKGYSTLTIYDQVLPEAVCKGKSNQGLRCSQLLQLDGKNAAFLRQTDPIVLTLRNRDKGPRTGLEVRMQDEWSQGNWNF